MSFPDHLLTLATLRLLTLTPLAATYTQSTAASTSTATATTSLHHHHQPQDRFHSVRSRPLHILTELTAAYLQLLGNAAKNHAEQAGRTLANALDAREAIADYGGTVDEIDEWARECQLDRGILSSNDALMNDAAGAAAAGGGGADGERAEAADLGALLKGEKDQRYVICILYTDTPIVLRHLLQSSLSTTHQNHRIRSIDRPRSCSRRCSPTESVIIAIPAL